MKLVAGVRRYLPTLIDPVLLIIALVASFTVVPLFLLPFRNPHNISNVLNGVGFNPENNFLRVFFVIVATLGIFMILRLLYDRQKFWPIKLLVICLLVTNFFIDNFIGAPHSFAFIADNYHVGEQISPGQALRDGKSLFDEIWFLRGAGYDALLPALSLALGGSLGAYLMMLHLSFLAAIFSFLLLLAFIIRGPILFTLVATVLYMSNAVQFFHVRDIPVWAIVGLLLFLFKSGLSDKARKRTLFAIGLLSGLEMYMSIDRGVLMLALSFLLAGATLVTRVDAKNIYSFSPKAWKQNLTPTGYILGGMLLGVAGPVVLLGWHSFASFLKLSFIELPSYQGLLTSNEFPELTPESLYYWGPVLLSVAAGYLLIQLYKVDWRKNLNVLIPLTILLIVSVLFIKVGTNRIALARIAYGSTLLFLTAGLLSAHAYKLITHSKTNRYVLLVPFVLCVGTIALLAQLQPSKLLIQPNYSRWQLVEYAQMHRLPDDHWISMENRRVKDHIKKTTSKDDYIYAYTSNPIYYYLTKRQNPTRFYISWFTDPQPYTEEALRDLKKNKPAVIIYTENSWMDAPDNVSMNERVPEINKWILSNYPRQVKIDNTVLLYPS